MRGGEEGEQSVVMYMYVHVYTCTMVLLLFTMLKDPSNISELSYM